MESVVRQSIKTIRSFKSFETNYSGQEFTYLFSAYRRFTKRGKRLALRY